MTKAYINYPNPHMNLHSDPTCPEIGKMAKANQRDIKIDSKSFNQAFAQLTGTGFRLSAEARLNDVWLTIEFDDAEFETAVANYVLRVLASRYSPLRSGPVKIHC